MVTWNPGVCFSARASRSVPEFGAPMMKTGWRTLRPLTTRMCGRGAMATISVAFAQVAGGGGQRARRGGLGHDGETAEAGRPGGIRPVLLAGLPDPGGPAGRPAGIRQ